MDPLLANSYFMQCSLGSYSNPLYSTTFLTGEATVSEYYPALDLHKPEIPDFSEESTNPSPPEPPTEPVKTDLRKVRRKGKVSGTNLYGRPYCPGRPLSMEERTRIIELHMGGMKVNAISKSLCISHGCVSKIISRYRSTGILTPASSPEQRRTRRVKKTESSPESVLTQDTYNHLDYAIPVPVQFIGGSPPDLLQSPPSSHFQPLLPAAYTVLHDPMMLQEYHHQQMLL